MKLSTLPTPRSRARGSTVMVLMILLGILGLLVTANVVSVGTLSRELKLLDKHQQQRLRP